MLRASGEQFTYQESGFNDLARTAALFGQTRTARTVTCLVDGWDQELLGCSLADYVGVTQLLQVAALRNEGRFDPVWLSQPQMEQICSVIPARTIREVTDRHFVTDLAAFKAENDNRRSSRDSHLRLAKWQLVNYGTAIATNVRITEWLPPCTGPGPRT
ncbi:hypothetical protein [Streptomyces sp. AK04-3B]|uniref:hypothetical protein n=1 Tax=unclassified Streptomyces TaxID=2593676 RepID=UPI0029A54BA1|nr:hypothetical protein [Streptomyces sp. AK04-3B]MDX3803908.1 hypothetical protein [Streptomyces sp. AK04-3B]